MWQIVCPARALRGYLGSTQRVSPSARGVLSKLSVIVTLRTRQTFAQSSENFPVILATLQTRTRKGLVSVEGSGQASSPCEACIVPVVS